MPYITDSADSLTQLLNHAAGVPDCRIAGYAIHAAFWLGEVEHGFGLLDGYPQRFRQTQQIEQVYFEINGSTESTRSLHTEDIRKSRTALHRAASRFFERCASIGLLESGLFEPIDNLLNLALYESPINKALVEEMRVIRTQEN